MLDCKALIIVVLIWKMSVEGSRKGDCGNEAFVLTRLRRSDRGTVLCGTCGMFY